MSPLAGSSVSTTSNKADLFHGRPNNREPIRQGNMKPLSGGFISGTLSEGEAVAEPQQNPESAQVDPDIEGLDLEEDIVDGSGDVEA